MLKIGIIAAVLYALCHNVFVYQLVQTIDFLQKAKWFFFLTFRCIYKTYTHHLSLDIQQIVHQIAL